MKKRPSTAPTGRKKSNVSNEANEEVEAVELTESVIEAKALEEKILLEEERDIIIHELLDELLSNTLEECYKIYMHRQTIAFTVHCACIALLDVIDFYMPTSDPGEPSGALGRPEWSGDSLPTALNNDVWAGHPVPVCYEPPIQVSPIKYYKSLANKEKSGFPTRKKNKSTTKAVGEAMSHRHVTIDDSVQTEPGSDQDQRVLLEELLTHLPVELKKKVVPKTQINREPTVSNERTITSATKQPPPINQRDKSLTGADSAKFMLNRMNTIGLAQTDTDRTEACSICSFTMEPVPVSKLQEDRIEMKYWVLPSDQSPKSKGKNSAAKKPSMSSRKDKKKPDIITLG